VTGQDTAAPGAPRYTYNGEYEIATAMLDAAIGYHALAYLGHRPDEYWVAGDPINLARDLARVRRLFGPDDRDTVQAVLTLTEVMHTSRYMFHPDEPSTGRPLPASLAGRPDDGPLLEPGLRDEVFDELIRPVLYGDLRGADRPSVHFIGGQPGAGKSQVNGRLEWALRARDGDGTVAPIAIDRYRDFHPYWAALVKADAATAGAKTNHDCWLWSHRARDLVLGLDRPPHVIHESSLRHKDDALADAPRYKERGFRVELHVVAVPSLVSERRYLHRFLREFQCSQSAGRLIPAAMHEEAFNWLPDSAAYLVESGCFDAVTIYDADGNPVHHLEPATANLGDSVADLVGDLQSTAAVDIRRLLAEWQESRDLARVMRHPAVTARLDALRQDIDRLASEVLPPDEFQRENPGQDAVPMTLAEEMAYEMADEPDGAGPRRATA
jgi:hypothetical protein